MRLEPFVLAPAIGFIVMIDMHEQKVIALFRSNNNGTVIIPDACAPYLRIDRLDVGFEMYGCLRAVVLEFPDEFEDFFCTLTGSPPKSLSTSRDIISLAIFILQSAAKTEATLRPSPEYLPA